MKKLFILALVSLLIAACAEDIDTNNISGQYITFNVADNNYLPEPEVDTRTSTASPFEESQQFVPQSGFNNYSINKKQDNVQPVESDLDEDLILTTTVEQGIRLPQSEVNKTRGGKTTPTSTFSFGVTERKADGDALVSDFENISLSYASATGAAAKISSGKTWESDAVSKQYNFYAYAPHITASAGTASASTNGLTLSADRKTIFYDARGLAVGDQPDLMTGYAESTYTKNGVNLTLDHRLAAVAIKTGTWTSGYKVESVTFYDIVGSGTYNIDKNEWGSFNESSVWTTTLPAAASYTVTDITQQTAASSDVAVYLMMIPQSVASVTMRVVLRDKDNGSHALRTTLTGNWTAGTTTTYTISPAGITTMTVNYPTGWQGTSGLVDGPVTDYVAGENPDHFGLYAIDKNNDIVFANLDVPAYSVDLTNHTATLNLAESYPNKFFSSQYTYYLYYPRKSLEASAVDAARIAAANNESSDADKADAFFFNVISGWTVAGDQSSDIKSSDLQVAKYSSGFSMAHRMGLVRLNPTTKSVDNKLTYTYNKTDGTYTSSTSGSATITASNDFTGNKPYTVSGQYWHIVKATDTSVNTEMSFTCNANQKDYWSAKSSGTDVGYGKYKVINIQSDRSAANFEALFSCMKTCQTITLPWYDSYKIQCWGASGGLSPQRGTSDQINANEYPGRGGYTEGTISLGKITLYVYVGSQGPSNVNATLQCNSGGWNGGGYSANNPSAPYTGGGGGGSTDIRISKHSSGSWGYNSSTNTGDASLRTRIMVAAGGGGCGSYYSGGHGGGTTGGTNSTHSSYVTQTGATQISTGSVSNATNWEGFFGYARQTTSTNGNGGGAGGGWWGGSTGWGTGGSGGSSFISGMSGCVAINSSGVQTEGVSTMTINGVSYTFNNPVTYGGGDANRPANPAESSTTYSNGYAKITSQ